MAMKFGAHGLLIMAKKKKEEERSWVAAAGRNPRGRRREDFKGEGREAGRRAPRRLRLSAFLCHRRGEGKGEGREMTGEPRVGERKERKKKQRGAWLGWAR